MRALQQLLLACASLAVSAENTYTIHLSFDRGCVQKCSGYFKELGSARGCIETVQRAAGECENATLWITYIIDEGLVSCRSPSHGGLVKGVPTGDLVRELSYLDYEWMFLVNVKFLYNQENPFMTSKNCLGATLRGTGDMEDPCTSITQEPYKMRSEEGMVFWPTPARSPFKLTDLALQADFGQSCLPSGNMTEVALKLFVMKAIKTPVAIKDATIAFPHQPDCAPSGCKAISGARDVKFCLNNARAEPSCKRAVYTRTYSNLTSFRCERTAPTRILLNMDSVLADDKALDFEDKQTLVTGVKFAYTSLNKECAAPVLRLGEHCYTLGLPSILVEFPPSSFNFIPDWRAAAGIDEYNKTRPSSKEKRLSYNPNGDEVNLKTQFQPNANYTLTVRCPVIENPDGNEATLKTHFTISRSGSSVSSTDGGESTAGVFATINTLTSRNGKRLIDKPDGNEVTLKTQSTMLHPESSSTSTSVGKSAAGVVATNYALTTKSGLIDNLDADDVTTKAHSASLKSKPSGSHGRIPIAGILTTAATILCICFQ